MIKRFLKDSALYTLANLFTKGIAFIMLPLYLSYLDKEAYGIFDYITTVGMVLAVVVALEIAQSVIRFSSEASDNIALKSSYISTGVFFTLFCYIVFIFIVHLNLEQVAIFLTGDGKNTDLASLAVFSYFATAMMYLTTVIYRSNLNAKAATLSSALAALATALLTFILLSYFSMGLKGIFYGIIAGQLVVAFCNLINLKSFLLHCPSLTTLKVMLRFSAPLVISSLGVIFATFADRLMIKEMLSFEELGEYAVAARLASGVALLTIGFQSALAPLVYSKYNEPETPGNLKKLFTYFSIVGVVAVLVAVLLASPVISLITTESYAYAPTILVILVAAVLLSNGYLFFPGLSIAHKTHILAAINIATGLLNIALNFLLIPSIGIYGAAIATLASALVSFLLNVYFSEKYYPIFAVKVVAKPYNSESSN